MRFPALARILFGVALTLLGLLWLLQGADLVHIRPILCVTNCTPLEGGSVGWMTPVGLDVGHESCNIGDTPIDLVWVSLKR